MMQTVTEARSQNSSDMPHVLESRDRYRPCHVVLSDTGERMPAIQFDGNYYSFFRSVAEKQRALELGYKLQSRGHSAVVTKTPKGFVVWVFEATAILAKPRANVTKSAKPDTPYRILTSPSDYQPCQIMVPDLDKRLSAVQYNSKLYSLFKTVDTLQQASQIIKRLSYRGDETIILQTKDGFSLFILEPEAVRAD
ncbi:hypothetical protein IQ267_23500 [filamentous cyanobacterium LEGE 07170]|nr:hypothetical protein [filamentous cyanobacterium LEGE 07170]